MTPARSSERRGGQVRLLHGADRAPWGGAAAARRPFFGIASRGVLEALGTAGAPIDWAAASPFLDPALAGDREAAARLPPRVLQAARDWGVLRFDETAAAVEAFARDGLDGALRPLGVALRGDETIECWNVKEGHTSSVWRITIAPRGGGPAHRVALNVARDRRAAEELRASAAALERFRACGVRVRVARVLAEREAPAAGAPGLVVQEWIEGARELGFVRERSGRHGLVAIDRFLTSAAAPGRIAAVVGERLAAADEERVLLAILEAVLDASELDPATGRAAIPRLEVAEGDWVLANGAPCAVAMSERAERLDLGEALGWFLLQLAAELGAAGGVRDRLHALCARAVQAFCARRPDLPVAGWVERARAVGAARWREHGWAGDPSAVERRLSALVACHG